MVTDPHPTQPDRPSHRTETSGRREDRFVLRDVVLDYGRGPVVHGVSTRIPDGSYTVLIGPNGCGKSTVLRALSGLLTPTSGEVLLEGSPLSERSPRQIAQQVGLLPQSATAPDGITVSELVSRGRYPHQGAWHLTGPEDRRIVAEALDATSTGALAGRRLAELSGGQRQRVWAAMLLAQQTDVLLLDEPTTFLDVAHQVDFLNLFCDLNRQGATVVAVLHDLNQAARYADHVIAMKDGRIVAEGPPQQVVTADIVSEVFGLDCVVIADPETGGPLVVPVAPR